VEEFAKLLAEHLTPMQHASDKIGGEAQKITELLVRSVEEQKKLILLASKSKKPEEKELMEVITALSTAISEVTGFAEKSKFSKTAKNHLTAISDSIPVLAWVLQPTPVTYAKEFVGTASFWTNKILSEFKGKNEDQVAWANKYIDFLKALPIYIKDFHATGLTWNPKGSSWKDNK